MSNAWNFTLDDTSPVLKYFPYGDGPLGGGWQSWFSESGFNYPPQCGKASAGDSLHITSFNGASLSLEFYGSAIFLFGSTNASYTVNFDSTTNSFQPAQDLLFAKTDLAPGNHYFNLTVNATADQQFAFDRAVVSNLLPSGATGLTPFVWDSSNATAINYSAGWAPQNDPQVPSSEHPKPFEVTTTPGSFLSFTFTGGAALAVNGSRNCGHGDYAVNLMAVDGSPVPQQFSANNTWLIGDAVKFFHGGLDPTKTYLLNVTNIGIHTEKLTMSDITVYEPMFPTPSSLPGSPSTANGSTSTNNKTNVGVIVGPIVAGVVLIIAGIAFFWWRKRQHGPMTLHSHSPGNIIPFEPDNYADSMTAGSMATETSLLPQARTTIPSQLYLREKAPYQTPPQTPVSAAMIEQAPVRSPMSRHASSTTSSSRSRPVAGPSGLRQEGIVESYVPAPQPVRQSASATSTSTASVVPPQANNVDVNQLIELIARRIDRPNTSAPSGPDAPPPMYSQAT